jgi:hypothetical protein
MLIFLIDEEARAAIVAIDGGIHQIDPVEYHLGGWFIQASILDDVRYADYREALEALPLAEYVAPEQPPEQPPED